MFKHIGSKIKGLAKFFFFLTCIVAFVAGIFVIAYGAGNVNNESSTMILALLIGIGIIIGGIIIGWLQNFLLYGFGELIDSNQKILELLQEKNNKK